jgi:ankyrin repeat protein
MALYVMNTLAQSRGPHDIVCRFFCDESRPSQDMSALLRALIFQIVSSRRKLLKVVRRASDRGGVQILRQFDTLWNVFIQVVCDSRIGSVTVIIDGIEGYDRKAQAMLIRRISELLRSDAAIQLKFFITSRPNAPAFQFVDASLDGLLLLRLEDEQQLIGEDVNLFIHQKLGGIVERGVCKPSTRDELEEILINKAGRTFLWVSLVFPLLEDRLVLRAQDVRSVAAQLPPDLSVIYERLLCLVYPQDRELVGRLLNFIVASGRPLSSDELSILIAIAPQHSSVVSLQDEQLPMDGRMVLTALGPLVRVCEDKVSLIHPSLQNYLIYLSSTPAHPLSSAFGIDMQQATRRLVSACTHYLALDEFNEDLFHQVESSDEHSRRGEADELSQIDKAFDFDLSDDPLFFDREDHDMAVTIRLASCYKLYDYAAVFWATDFGRCGGSALDKDLEAICSSEQPRLANWLRYFWIVKGLNEPCLPADALIVACYFGHAQYVERYLESQQGQHQASLWTCLYWAAQQGHTACVKAILHNGVVPQTSGISPLCAAAQNGHLDTLLALLGDDRIDVNAQGDDGQTALSLASANGHSDLVVALLSHTTIDVNLPDKSNLTAVFWAAESKSMQVMSYFLDDGRVDLDHVDKYGRTTLSWAAEDGAVSIIRSLMRNHRVTVVQQDSKGRTPISYAAQNGHLEVVRMLLKTQPEHAALQDHSGRNAHSWATCQPNSDVLHELLKHCPVGADMEDNNGWAALAWALSPPGYQDHVKELLQSGGVDINRKDNVNGRTPLSWAASYGFSPIVRMLSCSNGILLDAEDIGGRTPLSHAAGNGNTEATNLLLIRNNVRCNAVDHEGRTPLSWAALGGHCETISLLLSHTGIDFTVRDALGRLPYDIASAYGHTLAANILQAAADATS